SACPRTTSSRHCSTSWYSTISCGGASACPRTTSSRHCSTSWYSTISCGAASACPSTTSWTSSSRTRNTDIILSSQPFDRRAISKTSRIRTSKRALDNGACCQSTWCPGSGYLPRDERTEMEGCTGNISEGYDCEAQAGPICRVCRTQLQDLRTL